MSETVATATVVQQRKLDEWLAYIADNAPGIFASLVDITARFLREQTEAPTLSNGGAIGPLDVARAEREGYQLTTRGISDEDLQAIRESFAKGIVSVKAQEFLKGFITGLMVAP